MKIKLLLIYYIFSGNIFALSLGDTINANTMKMQTTITQTMKLSTKTNNHTEYTIANSSGNSIVLVNKQNKIYGFAWYDSSPNFKEMLGKYKPEFDKAMTQPNKFNHRMLKINTQHLSVQQFGLPNSQFHGTMYAKDLEPSK